MNDKEIKEKLFSLMASRLSGLELTAEDVDENTSLLTQGVFDSMAFIEFIAKTEEYFDIELDFEELDASDFTSVEQLRLLIKSSINK